MKVQGTGSDHPTIVPTGEILRDLCSTRKQLDVLNATVSDTRQVMDEGMSSLNEKMDASKRVLEDIREALLENNRLVQRGLDESEKLRAAMRQVVEHMREDIDERKRRP